MVRRTGKRSSGAGDSEIVVKRRRKSGLSGPTKQDEGKEESEDANGMGEESEDTGGNTMCSMRSYLEW